MRDDDAFLEFVAARTQALRRTAYFMCGDWHHAKDAVQAALIKLYQQPPRDWGAAEAWVRTVLVRTIISDSRRPWRRHERPSDDLPDKAASTTPDQVGDRALLLDALRRLPARQRAVVVLRFWDQMSVAEVARSLHLSEGTVKSHTSRGLKALRIDLEHTHEPV